MTFKTGNYRSPASETPGEEIPLSQVLPNGYEFRRAPTGQLQVWRVDVDPETLLSEQDVGILDVNGSIRAAVNTVYLENAHAIKSSGEEIAFKNLETGVNYMPAWAGATAGGDTIVPLGGIVEGPLTETEPNGSLVGSGAVTGTYTSVIAGNNTIYSAEFVCAESYTGTLSLNVRDSRNEVVFKFDLPSAVYVPGNTVSMPDIFYRIRVGNTRTVEVVKADGSHLNVRPGATDNTKPYRKYNIRTFADRRVVLVGVDGKIPLSDLPDLETSVVLAVNTEAERLALPQISKLYVVTQALAGPDSEAGHQWFLNPNDDPSDNDNWVKGGNTGVTVDTFNGRTGNVVPTAGDYNAAQVGAVALPGADAVRRVLIGNTPTQETIADNLTTDSSTSVLSAKQGKILNESKQANVTGAATTILNVDLATSRVMVTDGSGKVTVSTITPTELGWLAGATSNIQDQIDSRMTSVMATWQANGAGNTGATSVGAAFSTSGSALSSSMASTDYGRVRKVRYRVNATGSIAGVSGPAAFDTETGFHFVATWGLDSGSISNIRAFVGLKATQLSNSSVSGQFNMIGVGFDPNDSNLSVLQNNSSGSAIETDLGSNFPAGTGGGIMYRLEMKCDPGSTVVTWKITKLDGPAAVTSSGTFSVPDLPAAGTFLTPFISYMTTNSKTVRVAAARLSIKTLQ